MAVSTPLDMLFRTLHPQGIHVVHPQLWQNMWSKTLPAQTGNHSPARAGSVFCVSCWLDCNSESRGVQVLFARGETGTLL